MEVCYCFRFKDVVLFFYERIGFEKYNDYFYGIRFVFGVEGDVYLINFFYRRDCRWF